MKPEIRAAAATADGVQPPQQPSIRYALCMLFPIKLSNGRRPVSLEHSGFVPEIKWNSKHIIDHQSLGESYVFYSAVKQEDSRDFCIRVSYSNKHEYQIRPFRKLNQFESKENMVREFEMRVSMDQTEEEIVDITENVAPVEEQNADHKPELLWKFWISTFGNVKHIGDLELFSETDIKFSEKDIKLHQYLDYSPVGECLRSTDVSASSLIDALSNVRDEIETLQHNPEFKKKPVKMEDLKKLFDGHFLETGFKRNPGGAHCKIVFDNKDNTLCFVNPGNYSNSMNYNFPWNIGIALPYIETSAKPLRVAVRQNWIKYQCLHGQDDEFNIFRSLCFAPDSNRAERYRIGYVALILQILFCVGITIDDMGRGDHMFPDDENFGQYTKTFDFDDGFVFTICIFASAFIILRFKKTIEAFHQFYSNMEKVCIIPWTIIALDFMSNIVVGLWMTMNTPFFLFRSEDIPTVVFNSFALTFVIDLDDMANVFESDEAALLQEDANAVTRACRARLSKTVENILTANPAYGEMNAKISADRMLNLDREEMAKREIPRNWDEKRFCHMLFHIVSSPVYAVKNIGQSLCTLSAFLLARCCCIVNPNERTDNQKMIDERCGLVSI